MGGPGISAARAGKIDSTTLSLTQCSWFKGICICPCRISQTQVSNPQGTTHRPGTEPETNPESKCKRDQDMFMQILYNIIYVNQESQFIPRGPPGRKARREESASKGNFPNRGGNARRGEHTTQPPPASKRVRWDAPNIQHSFNQSYAPHYFARWMTVP